MFIKLTLANNEEIYLNTERIESFGTITKDTYRDGENCNGLSYVFTTSMNDDSEPYIVKDSPELIAKKIKEDKYKWHDLRKNPYDMPPAPRNGAEGYIIKVSDTRQPFSTYWNGTEFVNIYDEPETGDIRAWREIEPFEEINDGIIF